MAVPKLSMLLTKNGYAVRVMKLTAILLLTSCLKLSAREISQSIRLSLKNAPIEKVFKEIERQSDFTFFADNQLLKKAKRVTIEVNGLPLNQVLELCFKDQPFSYSISGKTITLGPKKEKIGTEQKISINETPPVDVKGRIVNSKGEPIPNATVSVQGSTKRTVSNSNGEFSLTGVEENSIIVISHVQFETESLSLNGRGIVNATLQIKINSLDELQVIAYGTTTKRLNTGNVSTVKSTDIEKQPVNNPLLALQGRVPGMVITQKNGLPGGGIVVQIRGQNSIEKSLLPLYVIDGVPYYSDNPQNLQNDILGNSGTGGGRGGNPLSYINSSDIESIDILKDADATAIYGSRGANGVVLITTKKGKFGKMKVDANFQTGIGQVANFVELLNTSQYLEMRNEAFKNEGQTPQSWDYDLNGQWDTTRYTDWQKELIGGSANYNHAQLSLSGGGSNISYLMSGTYHKETTVFPGELSNQQASFHFNLNSSSTDQKFKFNLSTNYGVIDNRLVKNDFTAIALTIAPHAPALYNTDGTVNWAPDASGFGTWTNPIAAYVNNKFSNQTNNLNVSAILSYEIIKGLEMKTSLGYNNLLSNDKVIEPAKAKDPSFWQFYGNNLRTARFANNRLTSWIIEPQLLYNKNISKGKLSVLLGATIQQNKNDGQILNAEGFSSDLLIEDINSAAVFKNGGMSNSQYKYNAVFGRLSYNWLDKYLINLTGRRDGSSRYGPANRFQNFGAAGIGWIFSKEKFVESYLNILSYGKIRASYGTTGNENVGDYSFLDLYSSTTVAVPYQGTQGLQITQPFTPDLAWEETKKSEIGIELGFLKDRINLAASYYQTLSSNQLIRYPVALSTGFNTVTRNLDAVIKNYGWEFTFNTVNVNSKNFRWVTSFNLFWNRNKLTRIDSGSVYVRYKDRSLSSSFLYKMAGVDPAIGVYRFIDSKGGISSTPNAPLDEIAIFERNPKFSGGFSNTIEFKDFQLDFLFQFVKQIGQDFLYNNIPGQFTDIMVGNQPVGVLGRWQKPGDIANIQMFSQNGSVVNPYVNATRSDQGYTDLSFIRLKNVSLSWQVPNRWKHFAHLQSCRLYLLGQNLLTFTKYHGLDPESRSISSLPPLRIITAGIQVGL
jgi:TonB-linked SusC/RagA family outer membrane protein